MKYIKYFETLHDEETSNNFYRYVSRNEFGNWVRTVSLEPMKRSDIDIIRDRYEIKGNYIRIEGILSGIYELVIYSYKYNFIIKEYNDEYFSLWAKPNYGTMVKTSIRDHVYIIDQFDGLLKLLDEFNEKSRINYRPDYGSWLKEDQRLRLHK